MSVVTAAAVTTAVATVGSAVHGAVKANKAEKQAKKDQQKADRAAKKAVKDAKAELDVNFYEGLSVNKTPYELQREALLATSANLINAAAEGDERGVAGTAGRILAADQAGQQQARVGLSQEMSDIDQLIRGEDASLAQQRADLDLGVARGAQAASADAVARRAAAQQQKHQSIASAIGAVGQALPLFMPSPVAAGPDPQTSSIYQNFLPQGGNYTGGGMPGVSINAVDPNVSTQNQISTSLSE